jgi:hypothetical protein
MLSDPSSSDYAVVIIGAVFVFATVSWIVSARKWFHGPVRTVNDFEVSTKDAYVVTNVSAL